MGKRVDGWAWGGEGEVDGCNPSLITNPAYTSRGNNGLTNTVGNHDVVMGNYENKEVQPGVVGAVNAHEFLTLGARGQLPSGSILSTWRVLKQFA